MKKSKLKSQLLFRKTNIARLTQNNLQTILGGGTNHTGERPKPRTDTISFTVITSSWKCIDFFGVTTSS
ncbi:MAG: hypothetical protein ACI9Y7_001056 [Dokdonia sp.]|jgi:hypothetical protein